ncbi:MAG: DUF6132 family protein [Flavobacteriales bacterium]
MIKKLNSLGKFSFVPGVIIGAVGGYLYWKFVGCSSGTCAITSSPVNSTLYFAGLGGLLFSSLLQGKKADNKLSNTNQNENPS